MARPTTGRSRPSSACPSNRQWPWTPQSPASSNASGRRTPRGTGAAHARRRQQGFLRRRARRRGARHARLSRHRRLRTERTRDHRARRHAARRNRNGAARARTDARLRAAAFRRIALTPTPLPRAGEGSVVPASPAKGIATFGGCIAAGLSGPRRASAGARARFRARRAHARRQGRRTALRRPGHEKRRRLRRLAADGGLARHARRDPRSLAQSAAAAGRAKRRCASNMPATDAIALLNEWGGQPLPLSASAWRDGKLACDCRAPRAAVEAAVREARRRAR